MKKLSEILLSYRIDRPDEWAMDMLKEKAEKLEAERDALAAQIELHKQRASKLSSLVDELIDHLRYNKTEQDDVLQEFWDKEEAIASVPSNPQQCLAEIRAEAVLQFSHWAFDTCPNIDCMFDDKDDYIAKIRQGGAKC